jgi:RNA polymerase sigma factor (sigma-70 family)
LQPDSISSEEIVDEVVARALDDSIEKPDRMGLEPWLYRLAIQAMGDLESRLVEAESDVHLQGVRRRRNELASDEPRLQFHQPDETLTTESSIADVRTSTPEQIAYSDEMIALIQFALRAVAPQDREAFVLYALEGFSTDEIVAITDRGAEEVGESIRKARSKVREAFPGSNPFESRRLQPTGTH